jgi:hypothetical protein
MAIYLKDYSDINIRATEDAHVKFGLYGNNSNQNLIQSCFAIYYKN